MAFHSKQLQWSLALFELDVFISLLKLAQIVEALERCEVDFVLDRSLYLQKNSEN